VIVDPYGYLLDPNKLATGIGFVQPNTPGFVPQGTIGVPRRSVCLSATSTPQPNGLSSLAQCSRWFALPDDITFLPTGVPDLSSGSVDRGGRFTYALLMRRPQASSGQVVDLSVIVYMGRSTQTLSAETPYPVVVPPIGNAGSTGITLDYTGRTKPAIRRGAWILDASYDTVNQVVQGYFYRAVSVTDMPNNQVALELQSPLKATMTIAVLMENVAEVIDKGSLWGP
jgi:hypothetical protein